MDNALPPKLTPKIILEETRLTHKTDIAGACSRIADWLGERRLLGFYD